MFKNMATLDIGVLALYFLVIFGVAIYFFFQRVRNRKGPNTNSYFLGGRDLSWWVIGASLFASNIGSEHLIGLAGAGAAGDFAAGQFEILASIILLVLGWFFVPFYMRSGVYTMPEFLQKRYSTWARDYLSWLSIVAYVLTKIAVTIAAGAIVFKTLLGVSFWSGALLIVIITGAYTILGGLKVVVYTDFVQMIILLLGSIALTWFSLEALGGWGELKTLTQPSDLSLWRNASDPDFPWTGILLGAPILGVWYWCTDQFIVQRVLAGKNEKQARLGTIFGGFLKLLPLFLFVLPGVIALALAQGPDSLITFPLEADGSVDHDAALPLLTLAILPVGFKGLVVAGLLAALMSSLSSVFNSCSTIFTLDIYRKYVPSASEKRLVYVGQIATVILVILGISWIPLMSFIEGGLFQKLQSIQAYISPPIAAVFLFGILSRRVTDKAAKIALITGALLGAIRLALEIVREHLHGVLLDFSEINFLHFAFMLFVICSIILFTFSKSKDAKPVAEISSITWQKNVLKNSGSMKEVILSAALCVSVLILWIVFK